MKYSNLCWVYISSKKWLESELKVGKFLACVASVSVRVRRESWDETAREKKRGARSKTLEDCEKACPVGL